VIRLEEIVDDRAEVADILRGLIEKIRLITVRWRWLAAVSAKPP